MENSENNAPPLRITGAYEHNLKNVDLTLPKKMLCALTGVSGSGKSSLAFNTIYVESMRRLIDSLSIPIHLLGNQFLVPTKRPKVKMITGLPPTLALAQKQGVSSALSTVGTLVGLSDLLRVYFVAYGMRYCKNCHIPLSSYDRASILSEITNRYANSSVTFLAVLAEKRKGAFAQELQKCLQLGFSRAIINGEDIDLSEKIPRLDHKKLNTLEIVIDRIKISQEKTKRIERAVANALEMGIGLLKLKLENDKDVTFNTSARCPQCGESSLSIDPRIFSHSSLGKCTSCLGTGAEGEDQNPLIYPCEDCSGTRLTQNVPLIKLDSHTFYDFLKWPLSQIHSWTLEQKNKLYEKSQGKQKILSEMEIVLNFITDLDLGHLFLNYPGNLLSPGDIQRLKLSAILASPLHSVTYILDEPCQGLSQNEIETMAVVLKKAIKNTQCSVLAVEHRPEFLSQCDHIVTLGPGAGRRGGEIVSSQTGKDFKYSHLKIQNIAQKITPTKETPGLHLENVTLNKWHFEKIFFAERKINLITGPSGSGKTLLASELVVPILKSISEKKQASQVGKSEQLKFDLSNNLEGRLQHVVEVLPGTLKRSSRRTIAALLDILPSLRQAFAQLPTSQILGLTPSHFSWSTSLGRCTQCQGTGFKEFHHKYGGKTSILCESCQGTRLNNLALQPRFKGKNFADILSLSLVEAFEFLKNFRTLSPRIEIPIKFGLGYLTLNQTLAQISGGEIQRLILSAHMNVSSLRETWFVLFHPSTGLHSPDILSLQSLVVEMNSKGATFIIVDNRQEMENFSHSILKLQRQ